nr:reverse transcriptase domain-containing protein [Tanacetum cinerariifolium]
MYLRGVTTTAFLRGETTVANQLRKKAPPTWRHHETSHKLNFDKRPDFKYQHKPGRRQDRFTPLIKTPKEILEMETVKFKAPTPMSAPAEIQNKNEFCEFHEDKGHNMDECIHLKRQRSQDISFPHLESNGGQENPMTIEAEVEGHLIHRMYVDGGFASEVLYEHCFNRLRPEVKSQMTPATTPLLGFSEEIS